MNPTTAYVVEVREQRADALAASAAISYTSPPQPEPDARALAALLADGTAHGPGPWRRPIAGGQRTITLRHQPNPASAPAPRGSRRVWPGRSTRSSAMADESPASEDDRLLGPGESRPARRGEICDCGRPAITVLLTDTVGEVPWCGTNDLGPVDDQCSRDARRQLRLDRGRPITWKEWEDANASRRSDSLGRIRMLALTVCEECEGTGVTADPFAFGWEELVKLTDDAYRQAMRDRGYGNDGRDDDGRFPPPEEGPCAVCDGNGEVEASITLKQLVDTIRETVIAAGGQP
jgi:hypothetical protein